MSTYLIIILKSKYKNLEYLDMIIFVLICYKGIFLRLLLCYHILIIYAEYCLWQGPIAKYKLGFEMIYKSNVN